MRRTRVYWPPPGLRRRREYASIQGCAQRVNLGRASSAPPAADRSVFSSLSLRPLIYGFGNFTISLPRGPRGIAPLPPVYLVSHHKSLSLSAASSYGDRISFCIKSMLQRLALPSLKFRVYGARPARSDSRRGAFRARAREGKKGACAERIGNSRARLRE